MIDDKIYEDIFNALLKFDPNQPRDQRGRWSITGSETINTTPDGREVVMTGNTNAKKQRNKIHKILVDKGFIVDDMTNAESSYYFNMYAPDDSIQISGRFSSHLKPQENFVFAVEEQIRFYADGSSYRDIKLNVVNAYTFTEVEKFINTLPITTQEIN